MNMRVLDILWGGNSVKDYLVALATFLIGVLVVRLIVTVVLKRLQVWAERSATTIDDFLIGTARRIFLPLAYFGVLYASALSLVLPGRVIQGLRVVGTGAITFCVTKFMILLLQYLSGVYWRVRGADELAQRSARGILNIVSVMLWGIALVFFFDNLGFQVSAIIAGLGVGGIAVGLAAQAVLKDFFSYFSIMFDRPFVIGDFIIVGDAMGTVEYIGAKTTRIRSLSGEQIIFSNTDLTDSRVRNFKRMNQRRVVFRLGVVYQTPQDRLKEIPGLIEQIIKKQKYTVFDRAHFFSFGDFSLIFEIVYYVEGSDYNRYMDVQQAINFAVREEFQRRGIEFAYPTQTVFVTGEKT